MSLSYVAMPRGDHITGVIDDLIQRVGKIQKDALIQALQSMDIREFLARSGVMNPGNSSEIIALRLRRWIPACD